MKHAGGPGAALFSAGVLKSMLTGVSQFFVLAAQMGRHCRRGAGVHISIMASLEGTLLDCAELKGQFEMMDFPMFVQILSLKFSASSQFSLPLALLSSHLTSSSPSHVSSARPSLSTVWTPVRTLSTSPRSFFCCFSHRLPVEHLNQVKVHCHQFKHAAVVQR